MSEDANKSLPLISELTVELYQYPIALIVGDIDQINDFIRKQNIEYIETHEPVAMMSEDMSGKVVGWEGDLICFYQKWPYINTVVHESVHIANKICLDLGITYSRDEDEQFAYLVDHIFTLQHTALLKLEKQFGTGEQETEEHLHHEPKELSQKPGSNVRRDGDHSDIAGTKSGTGS